MEAPRVRAVLTASREPLLPGYHRALARAVPL